MTKAKVLLTLKIVINTNYINNNITEWIKQVSIK